MKTLFIFIVAVFSCFVQTSQSSPNNYGVTHAYAVHLGPELLSEFLPDMRASTKNTVSAGIAIYYYRRETVTRHKDGQKYLDSDLDKYLPVVALALQVMLPNYTEGLYARHYTHNENVYLSLIDVNF